MTLKELLEWAKLREVDFNAPLVLPDGKPIKASHLINGDLILTDVDGHDDWIDKEVDPS